MKAVGEGFVKAVGEGSVDHNILSASEKLPKCLIKDIKAYVQKEQKV